MRVAERTDRNSRGGTLLHAAPVDGLAARVNALERLPLVTLYLSERCNSRCVTCDYWRHGVADLCLEQVRGLLPDLARAGTQVVLISGGEPLLNTEWAQIAALLRKQGLKLWLLTSGLSLAKHAERVAALFDAVTVSLDGTDAATYQRIRGLDAFDKVCEGVRALARTATPVSLRVTVQRANYRQLPQFVALARALGAQQVSFLAVDVANPHAFARREAFSTGLALAREDLPALAQVVDDMERELAAEFRSGLIADSPRKLRRIHRYFSAVCGLGAFPPVHCNVFEYSAVIGATGQVSPCFFISGPPSAQWTGDLDAVLNAAPMKALRADIRSGRRPECERCVCSLWREPDSRAGADFLPRERVHA